MECVLFAQRFSFSFSAIVYEIELAPPRGEKERNLNAEE